MKKIISLCIFAALLAACSAEKSSTGASQPEADASSGNQAVPAMRAQDGYIEYQSSDGTWKQLVSLDSLKGEDGASGINGVNGTSGRTGAAGVPGAAGAAGTAGRSGSVITIGTDGELIIDGKETGYSLVKDSTIIEQLPEPMVSYVFNDDGLLLSWDQVDGADHYEITIGTDPETTYTTADTQFQIPGGGLTVGKQYEIYVTALAKSSIHNSDVIHIAFTYRKLPMPEVEAYVYDGKLQLSVYSGVYNSAEYFVVTYDGQAIGRISTRFGTFDVSNYPLGNHIVGVYGVNKTSNYENSDTVTVQVYQEPIWTPVPEPIATPTPEATPYSTPVMPTPTPATAISSATP